MLETPSQPPQQAAPENPYVPNKPLWEDTPQSTYTHAFEAQVGEANLAKTRAAKLQRDVDQKNFENKTAFNLGTAALDTLDAQGQTQMMREEQQQRQASLPGFTEFKGEYSDPGSLFYRNEGPRTGSAFGTPAPAARQGGTLSMAPMGGRAEMHAENAMRVEDANSNFERNIAETRAADPFGLNVFQAKQGFIQSRLEGENRLYAESIGKLQQQLQQGLIDQSTYESTKQAMDQERLIRNEQIQPKGGFERGIGGLY